nr:Chain C, 10-mer peptide from 2A proteinase [Enterovirus A71]
GSITTLGKFG